VTAALEAGCDLLLTHHPLFFKPLKNINLDAPGGGLISRALQGGLSIFAAHTNWDAANQGVAHALADLLELTERRPLSPSPRDFLKLAVFVPKGYEPQIRRALFEAGAGAIGDYGRCYFQAAGEGGFKAPPEASPFLGQAGRETRAGESRLEVIVPRPLADQAALAVLKHHPYEEPAFEFYPVKVYGPGQGLGLVGVWKPARDFLSQCREKLPAGGLKWAGPEPGLTETVALLPGSGGGCAALARRLGAQALITGDVSYHQALEAAELGLTVADLGHFETEWPGLARLEKLLSAELARLGQATPCLLLPQTSPWHYGA
jgi:dinuclear metal center YbgI/SA1388 family protein